MHIKERFSDEELKTILTKHKQWLNSKGKKGQRAVLEDLNLTGSYLKGSDLRGALFYNTSLESADLRGANLEGVNLREVDLRYARLQGANLKNTSLEEVNLRSANLESANLYNANLRRANLCNAILLNANLEYAILERANLEGSILDKKEIIRKGLILEKSMFGYKKCINKGNIVIVKLSIPKGSVVFSINNGKCRTNTVKVLSIVDLVGNKYTEAFSLFDNQFKYEVGKKITIRSFDLAYNAECSTGIHFFRTKKEAINYKYM